MEIGGISGFNELQRILRLLEIRGNKSIPKGETVKFGLDKAEISPQGETLLKASIEKAFIEQALKNIPSIRESKLKEVENKLKDNFYSSEVAKDRLADILSYIF